MRKLLVPLLLATVCFTNLYAQQKKQTATIVHQIPGKLECEFYMLGREGSAYHDTDSINNGSGKLNPANGTYLNEFRMKEGVDISYTKGKGVDDSPYNSVQPLIGQLYVGWTQPGEWINYSVNVKTTGNYAIDLMYTANGDGTIAFELDGKPLTESLTIPSTADDRDSIAWRQWHHWNKVALPGNFFLSKGKHVLTLRTIDHGNMNFDFFDFRRKK